MKLRFSILARNDLISIGEWIAKENPEHAFEYVLEIEASCRRLTDFPLTGEKIGHYQMEEIRRKVHDRYLVLYTIREETVFVVRVIHSAQNYLRFLD